uniref:Modulator of smoothened n=1 Tax=Oncorhynchus kisutch TaxID=8019 RepID=A0A8C7JSA5_ONCKI
MDKLTIISGCLFLAADIFAIASIANPDWINTGESAGALTVGLVRQCQTIHGRDRTCIPPRLPPEWVTTLFFIILGIISLTVTCGLLVASHWRREATKYARWIAFTGSVMEAASTSLRDDCPPWEDVSLSAPHRDDGLLVTHVNQTQDLLVSWSSSLLKNTFYLHETNLDK